jgi:hypothetical protein
MPRGKAPAKLGGVGWVNRATLNIDASEMLHITKKGVAPPGGDVLEAHSITLIDAFRDYQIKRKGAITATSRRRVMNLIAKRADEVLQAPESETWRENLSDALECTLDKKLWKLTEDGSRIPTRDNQFRVEIDHLLLGAYRKNTPPAAQLKDLKRALNGINPFNPSEKGSLKLLSELPIHLIVNSGKWGDPALVDLIKRVGPVWRDVTGRSLKHTSKNKADDKHSLFGIWLSDTLKALDLPSPPHTHVTKIVKFLDI